MKNQKKILLTGASGTVGLQVLQQLLLEPDRYDITVFDLNSKKSRAILSSYSHQLKIAYGDIGVAEDVELVCFDKDVVIHLAAIIPPLADEDTALAYHVNVQGTINLMEGLRKHSPSAFIVYGSSISVYGDRLKNPWIKVGDPLMPSVGDEYAKTKMEGENIIQRSNLEWCIFRLTAIMGIGNHKISKLLFHMPLNTSLEILTPEDAARAFVKAIDHREVLTNKIFNLGGGEACRISFKEFLMRSLDYFGLGKLDFAESAFAEKNFHCGYYADGDILNQILHFRKDTLDSYFNKVRQSVSRLQRAVTYIFKKPIKRYLLKRSEPFLAKRNGNEALLKRFFETP